MEQPYRSRRFTLGGRRKTPAIKIAQMQGNLMELVGNNPEIRNWKGIVVAIFAILVVFGIVALSVFLMAEKMALPFIPNLNVSDIVEQNSPISKSIWAGETLIFKDGNGNIREISAANGAARILISKQTLSDNGIVDWKFSNEGRYALLVYNKNPIYTYSYRASYYLYDVHTREKNLLIHDKIESVFQYAEFGKIGSSILYSLNGDLYYKPNIDDTESKRLTTGGILGSYHNGIADWIYEEEILKESKAFWWSPSGRYLAYASFDDRKVPESFIVLYEKDYLSDSTTYESEEKYKCPKIGYANPTVNIHTINMETFKHKIFQAPVWKGQKLDIFHSLTWLGDDEFLIMWSNVTKTTSVMQRCFPSTRTCVDYVTSLYAGLPQLEKSGKVGWLANLEQKALPSGTPGVFFYIKARGRGGMKDFNHVALVNITKTPSATQFLTRGNWEVSKLLHYDVSARKVYYISNEKHLGSRHVFSVDLSGNSQCVTCDMVSYDISKHRSAEDIEDKSMQVTAMPCQYFDATFGTSSEWFAIRCLGPGVPFSGIVRISEAAYFPSSLRILQPRNEYLKNLVQPTMKFETISEESETSIETKTLIPAQDHAEKRPVVFFKEDVGSQTVDYKYQVDLASYVVKTIGAFAVFVDGRGSGSRGNQLLHSSVGNPGTYEIEDMKKVLKFMNEEYPDRVDTKNVAVVGTTGYGGYVATLSLREPEFRCAVAKSPIADWSLHNSFDSGRILGSASKDSISYQKHNLLNVIEEISSSRLKIFHSLQDRKVNMQHSVLLKQAALLSDLPPEAVEVTFHTRPSHLDGDDARAMESNIYESITFFLKNCLLENNDAGLKI